MTRRWAHLTSLALHGAAFLALIVAPEIPPPEPPKTEYQMAIQGHEEKLVWYHFKTELPEVSPAKSVATKRPPRAESKAKQQIAATPKDAPKRNEIVYTPAPDLAEPPPEMPNLLAFSVKLPPTREFIPPPVLASAVREIAPAPDAPQLSEQTPELDLPKVKRVPTRDFVPPPQKVPEALREVRTPTDAPEVAANLEPVDLPHLRTIPRDFKTPPPATARPTREIADAGDAPTIAAVRLNPTEIPPVELPTASSPARMTAGPVVRKQGSEATGNTTGVQVPDLSIGGKPVSRLDLKAEMYASPTSSRTTQEALRLARNSTPRAAPEQDGPRPAIAMRVSGAPDPRLQGRDIYMMAIQMPNLTSYSGSWLMWYADRTAHATGLGPVSPPVAHRKVDPKYVASAASEHIEGKVQLACVIDTEGHISGVELVRGLDDRLNRSAIEALSKWEFYHATAESGPVAVDVLVEIPFKLAPGAPVPF